MEIIKEIGLQVVEILTLIFGILGMTFSAMLIFSPARTKSLGKILNRSVNVDDKIGFLDKGIEISAYLYSHHVVVGLMMIAGSAFALFFFFFSLDMPKFTTVFFGDRDQIFFGEIFFNSILWIGKITCLFGLLVGATLMLAPDKLRRLEDRLNSWFETKSMIKRLDQSSNNVDSFFFRYPLPVGLTGAILSFIILSLSIINLLD
jgi:hypothetical protein